MARKFNRKNILFVLISTAFLALGLIYTNCGSNTIGSAKSSQSFGKFFSLFKDSGTTLDEIPLTDDQKEVLTEINKSFDEIQTKLFDEKESLIPEPKEAYQIISDFYSSIEPVVLRLPDEYISQYKNYVAELNVGNVKDNFFQVRHCLEIKSNFIILNEHQKDILAQINKSFDDINSKLFDEKGNLKVLEIEAYKIVSNFYSDIDPMVSELPDVYQSQFKIFVSNLNEENAADIFLQSMGFFSENIEFSVHQGGSSLRLITIPMVESGYMHSCAIVHGGCSNTLNCWGDSYFGQLGIGNNTNQSVPVSVSLPGEIKFVSIAPASFHTCAIVNVSGTDQMFCWGLNNKGQLGIGNTIDQSFPVQVNLPGIPKIISTGNLSTCAIATVSGINKLYCWGENSNGELGLGSVTNYTTPQFVNLGVTPEDIEINERHACAILTSGALKCWGANQLGQLGIGSYTGQAPLVTYYSTPQTVILGGTAKSVSLGSDQTCAIATISGTDQLKCWGMNQQGQLGIGNNLNQNSPQLVTLGGPAKWVELGTDHACAITTISSVDKLKCWGRNYSGQLGLGNFNDYNTPQLVAVPGVTVQMSLGVGHTCAFSKVAGLDKLYCWGDNSSSQLGLGNTNSYSSPQLVNNLVLSNTGGPIRSIDTGNRNSCALLSNGTVKCWGQLASSYTPVLIAGISTAVAVDVGTWHACALLANGTIKCWGDNQLGSLGNGTTISSPTAVTVSNVSTATAISVANEFYGCALLANGTIKCWGGNFNGQLGNGTTSPSSVPVTVSNISTAIAVSAGTDHACALLLNGQIQCWGRNFSGQLGNGTTTNSNIPVTVSNISTAIAVSAGNEHTCAILSGGQAKCWGFNNPGQLGNGTTTNSSVPVPVSNLSNVVKISGGTWHTCSLLANGTVKCWGENYFGALGNGTLVTSFIPVTVNNISTAIDISAGSSYSCALLACGPVKCWGDNPNGQLGDGTTTDRWLPTTVINLP